MNSDENVVLDNNKTVNVVILSTIKNLLTYSYALKTYYYLHR